MEFVHEVLPCRVVFGAGSRNGLSDELDRLGITQVIIYATPEHASIASTLARSLGERAGFVYPGAKQSVRSDVTHSALVSAQSVNANGLVAVGGDAAMNLTKAVAVRSGLPQVMLPMTFSGSEVSPILRETGAGGRVIRREARAMPGTVLYDPDLAGDMSPAMRVSSAFTAMAHAMEGLYPGARGVLTAPIADSVLVKLSARMPALASEPSQDDMGEALTAAWLGGNCLAQAGMGLHHQLCHFLADQRDIPVEDVHAILLGHTAAYNRPGAGDALARAARQLGAEDAPAGLHALMRSTAKRQSLAELGFIESDLDEAAAIAFEGIATMPRRPEEGSVRALLQRALEGLAPE